MSPPPIKIRVGGEIDPSLARSLSTAQNMVGRASKAVQREHKATTAAVDQEAKKQLKAQQALSRATESLDRQRARGLYKQYQDQQAGAERAAKAQERAAARAHAAERREIEKTARAAAKAIEKERREKERSEKRVAARAVRDGESFARRTSHRASRFLMPEAPIGPMVMRGLGDVARGAGVDFSLQGMVSRNVELQQRAVDLSNSGYQPGAKGPNGQRVDSSALVAQARDVAGTFGMDAADVFGGLEQYQKIAGDLDTGRQSLFQMAQLAKATGTNLSDMAAATANVSNGLGDIPNKAAVIDQVMRTIAGQGKLGAVEISDMATQMARIAAAASNFGGDRAKNIQTFGALAQIARAEGGAPSAAEAARSMGGFANTFKKAARSKEFTAITHESAFTDKTNTQLRDPIDLIKTALTATKGDQIKMNKIFMDVVGGRTVTGLSKAYTDAGGGQKGLDKVDELIARMMKAQISQDQVAEDAKRSADTAASKAARFQNELDKVTESVMAKLLPALEQASPSILAFAETVGKVATWAVNNPKTAIATAITASIARAGLESTLRAGIERLLLGATGADGHGVRAGKLGSLAATAGGALTVISMGVTTLTVGMALIDNWFANKMREQGEAVGKGTDASNSASAAFAAERAGNLGQAKTEAENAIRLKEEEIAKTKALMPGGTQKVLESILAPNPAAYESRDKSYERALDQQYRELNASRELLARIAEAIERLPPPDGGGGDGSSADQGSQ